MKISKADKVKQFATLYADPTNVITYENASASYRAMYPMAKDSTCKTEGARLAKDPLVVEAVERIRLKSRTAGAQNLGQYLQRNLEMANGMYEKAIETADPRWVTAVPKMMENIGKASGFFVTKTEDVTPVERKFAPMLTAESRAALREQLDRLERIDKPNPLPQITATIAEYEIFESTTPETQEGPAEDSRVSV